MPVQPGQPGQAVVLPGAPYMPARRLVLEDGKVGVFTEEGWKGCYEGCDCNVLLYIEDTRNEVNYEPPAAPPRDLVVFLHGPLVVYHNSGRKCSMWCYEDGAAVEVGYELDYGTCHHRVGLRVNGAQRNWDSGKTELVDTREQDGEDPPGPRWDYVTLQKGDRLQLYIRNVSADDPGEPCSQPVEQDYDGSCQKAAIITPETEGSTLLGTDGVHDDYWWRTQAHFECCEEFYKSYKLTECGNPGNVLYTNENYLELVGKGKIIKLSDGKCYELAASTQAPTASTFEHSVYDSCAECVDHWYKLTDCADYDHILVTWRDLSAYDGGVVRLDDGCCYMVEWHSLRGWDDVTVLEGFDDCWECFPQANCQGCNVTQPPANMVLTGTEGACSPELKALYEGEWEFYEGSAYGWMFKKGNLCVYVPCDPVTGEFSAPLIGGCYVPEEEAKAFALGCNEAGDLIGQASWWAEGVDCTLTMTWGGG